MWHGVGTFDQRAPFKDFSLLIFKTSVLRLIHIDLQLNDWWWWNLSTFSTFLYKLFKCSCLRESRSSGPTIISKTLFGMLNIWLLQENKMFSWYEFRKKDEDTKIIIMLQATIFISPVGIHDSSNFCINNRFNVSTVVRFLLAMSYLL